MIFKRKFLRGQIVVDGVKKSDRPLDLELWGIRCSSLIFVNVDGTENQKFGSYEKLTEIEKICEILKELKKENISPERIAVITYFNLQKYSILKMLPKNDRSYY